MAAAPLTVTDSLRAVALPDWLSEATRMRSVSGKTVCSRYPSLFFSETTTFSVPVGEPTEV